MYRIFIQLYNPLDSFNSKLVLERPLSEIPFHVFPKLYFKLVLLISTILVMQVNNYHQKVIKCPHYSDFNKNKNNVYITKNVYVYN